MIYPTAGKASPGETFHEGTESHIIRRQNQLEPIRAEIERMVKEAVGKTRGAEAAARERAINSQIIRMVENPRSRQGKMGEVATKIAQWFKEERDYMRAAGVDIGDVKNYYAREFDRSKIIANKEGFIGDATRAYMEMGVSREEAERAADALWFRRAYGADGTPGSDLGGGGKPLFLKGRELTPEAWKHLDEWRLASVMDTMEAYLMRSTRVAEIQRRFGYTPKELEAMRERGGPDATVGKEGAYGKWDEMEKQILKEAPGLKDTDLKELRAMVS